MYILDVTASKPLTSRTTVQVRLVLCITSGKWAFGQAHLVPAVIWAGTKGLATSPQIRPPAREPIVPVRYKPLVPV
jgi:hypothetical protein